MATHSSVKLDGNSSVVLILDGNSVALILDDNSSVVLLLDGNSFLCGTYIRWKSMLFGLFKAFDYIESSYKSDIFLQKPLILLACAICSEQPS